MTYFIFLRILYFIVFWQNSDYDNNIKNSGPQTSKTSQLNYNDVIIPFVKFTSIISSCLKIF